MITKERAFVLVHQWGSFMHATDPGACIYRFHYNDGRPVSESHRLEVLRYLRTKRAVTKKDERELQSLIRFMANAPLRQEVLA